MQNLSLQMAQVAQVNKITDALSKNSPNSDKQPNVDSNTPFQMVLAKQVQAQQEPPQQNSDKNDNTSHASSEQKVKTKSVNSQSNASSPNDKKTEVKKSGEDDTKTDADANLDRLPGPVLTGKTELDPKKIRAKKEDADTKGKDVVTDSNSTGLVSSPIAPVPTSLLNTQASSSVNNDLQMISASESTTKMQRSLDAVLSNSLSQTKNANVSDKNIQDALGSGTEKKLSDTTSWLDSILPGAAKQAVDVESVSAKLLNSVKDIVDKEVVFKEPVMTASYQQPAQIIAASTTQMAGSANSISAYPGKAGWDQAISQKVMWMVGVGEQSATLTLNPPDLGPLQVVIHVHNDQADTTFISDNAEVRQALQDGLSNLGDKMRESGIQLGQTNVSSGEQSQKELNQASQNRLSEQQSNSITTSQAENVKISGKLVRVTNGLVDTFA